MSQFPGDKGSQYLAGTLGGPGYGEFPLGSAGPRVDPRDPRYIPPPQPGSGTNLDRLESLLRLPEPRPGGGGIFDRLQPVKSPGLPQPPRMDVGEPVRPPLGSIVARPGIMPGEMDFPRPRFPDPMPRFPEPTPMPRPMPGRPDQRMPQPPAGAGSLFAEPDKAGYNRILSNLYQDQYRNQQNPYAAQADYLMNRPVYDRGPRTDDPMFGFQPKKDPFATMAGQQPIRDAANAAATAAAQAQQDQLAADEAAAAQAAANAVTAEEAAIAQAEQERIAVEQAAAAQSEQERIAAEEIAAAQAAAAAGQQEAAAAAAAAQAAAEAQSAALAKAAEDQRFADMQERMAALDGRFGGFEGRFGGFDPAAIQANIAAAQAAAAANAETIAGTPAVDPDMQARIDAMQGQLGNFGGILDGFDPAALQANIAAAQAAADANAATIADTPAVDPGMQARIDAMQGELGGFGRRFEGFDPAALRAQIEGLSLGAGAGAGAGSATPPGFVAPTDTTVQKSREGVVGRNLGGIDNDAIRARIDALQNGTPAPQVDFNSSFSDAINKVSDAPSLPGGGSYSDVVAAGGGGINPVVGTRADGTKIRLFDPDNPNRQGNPAPIPKPQIDPSSLFSDPGLGGGPSPSGNNFLEGLSQQPPMDENTRRRVESGMDGKGTDNRKPYVDPSSLFSDPGLGGGGSSEPPLRQAKPFEPKLMPGISQGPVIEGPGFTNPTPKSTSASENWADAYVEQYPEWDDTQKAEARAWAVENYNRKDGEEGTMPSWMMDSDFLKGFEAANKTRPKPKPKPKPKRQPPRSGPKPRLQPKTKTKAPSAPRSGPKPKVISDPVKPKKKAVPRGKITDRRTKRRGR